MENKITLAHCAKKNRFFCIELRKRQLRYEAINFIELTETEYASLPCEIFEENLFTAESLLLCKKCGSRKIAGCRCEKNSLGCRSAKYNFQCLYCDELKIASPKRSLPKIYVTSPHFDDIGKVLNTMNLEHSRFSGKYDCDLLFINCGTSDLIDTIKLQKFVSSGGCAYISDLASQYITKAFPGMMSFSNIGNRGKMWADVLDPELHQIIGNNIEIEFDLGSWSIIQKVSMNAKVLMRASSNSPYAGKPIMVKFNYGKGTVFYTSFHNHSQASEKEKMLLQLLLLKQMSTTTKLPIDQMGTLVGLNISSMKEKFKK